MKIKIQSILKYNLRKEKKTKITVCSQEEALVMAPLITMTRRTSATNEGRLIASAYSTNLPNTSGESSGYGELIARATLPGQMSANAISEQGPAEDIIFRI